MPAPLWVNEYFAVGTVSRAIPAVTPSPVRYVIYIHTACLAGRGVSIHRVAPCETHGHVYTCMYTHACIHRVSCKEGRGGVCTNTEHAGEQTHPPAPPPPANISPTRLTYDESYREGVGCEPYVITYTGGTGRRKGTSRGVRWCSRTSSQGRLCL